MFRPQAPSSCVHDDSIHALHSVQQSGRRLRRARVGVARTQQIESPAVNSPSEQLHNWQVDDEKRNADTHVVVDRPKGNECSGPEISLRG